MKSKVLVLGLFFSLLICSRNLEAKERRGAELMITKTEGQQIRGELIAVKPSSLLLLDSRSGVDVSVAIKDIGAITVVKKSRALSGAGIGLALGAALGALIGAVGFGGDTSEMETEPIGYGVLIGGVTGLILGGGIGEYMGKDKTVVMTGNAAEEYKAVLLLEELRSQARVANFK